MGKFVYFNMGCTVLDETQVVLGDRVLVGPNVKVLKRFSISSPVSRCTAGTQERFPPAAPPSRRTPQRLPQIYAGGHDVDPEARKGTDTLLVKPVQVSRGWTAGAKAPAERAAARLPSTAEPGAPPSLVHVPTAPG